METLQFLGIGNMNFDKILTAILIISLIISCNSLPDVGDGYLLQSDPNSYIVVTDTSNTLIVYGDILSASSDSTFILLHQNPVDSVCECNKDCLYDKYPNANELPTLKMCKKAFKESKLRKYWIVDKSKKSVFNKQTRTRSNVYGPYDMEDYLKKRDELRVPPELILEIEEN